MKDVRTRIRTTAFSIAASLMVAALVAAGEPCEPEWHVAVGQPGSNSSIRALAVYDDGSGPALYAGGSYSFKGEASLRIARWDGSEWSEIPDTPNMLSIQDMTVFDDGSGPALYIGTGGAPSLIRRWDGAQWSAIDGGLASSVFTLRGFDDGTGPALYAGGLFSMSIAKWDGKTWSSLGLGMSEPNGNQRVFDIEVFDDGSGPAIYAGGIFTAAGTTWASNIAKWDGQQWHALGTGVDGTVMAMAVFDDGSGPALFVGGNFGFAGGALANRIAKWDGYEWSDLNGGVEGPGGQHGIIVYALTVYDDGSGPALYTAGSFSSASGVPANRIARWDGKNWFAVGEGVSDWDWGDLAVYDDGNGAMLYAGSNFMSAGGMPTNRIAAWGGCAAVCALADLDCDGTVGVTDLLILLASWGACADPQDCPADLDGDGTVRVSDLLILLANWG